MNRCRTSCPCTVMSGLSLRWYSSFEICSSWSKLKDEAVDPETERDGIHIILVQDADGGVIVGDSHEYTTGDFEERFRSRTEAAILREARKLVRFPHWNIAERWLGIYPLHPDRALYEETVAGRIHICTGSAGKRHDLRPRARAQHHRPAVWNALEAMATLRSRLTRGLEDAAAAADPLRDGLRIRDVFLHVRIPQTVFRRHLCQSDILPDEIRL